MEQMRTRMISGRRPPCKREESGVASLEDFSLQGQDAANLPIDYFIVGQRSRPHVRC